PPSGVREEENRGANQGSRGPSAGDPLHCPRRRYRSGRALAAATSPVRASRGASRDADHVRDRAGSDGGRRSAPGPSSWIRRRPGFLGKMIQFPRWLPEVTDDDRRRLAARDVEQYFPALNRDALRQEFDRFPRNPRELRTLLRGMWGLNSQSKRYRENEISW